MPKIYTEKLVGVRQSVVDEFLLLNEHQTPLIQLVGFSDPVTNVKHEWYEDVMFSYESKLAADVATADATTIEVEDAEPFRVNQVVKVGEELMLVTEVTGTTLTVVRGYASTEAAPHSTGDKVEVLFTEGVEGQDAREARYKSRKRVENICQIFDDTIHISGTAMAVAQHGVDDEYDKERFKKQLELALQLEKALINGIMYESGQVRQMRGIRSFIQTNVEDAGGNPISDTILNDAFQRIYEKGGFDAGANYKILVGAKQKRAISDMGKDKVRIDRLDNGRGQVVDHFISDFGQAEIVLNNNLAADEVIIIDANRVSIRPLNGREFSHTFLGLTGDSMKGQIVGEYTLEFLQEAAHARIKNLA